MSDQIKSNKSGYDVLHNPIAPNLLFNIGEQPESVYLYTPHIVPTGNGWNLVWTNNAGLDNPPTIHIMDGEKGNNGTTFTPHVSAVTGGYEISWTNDTGEENPQPVTILNGAPGVPGADGADGANGGTFIPHVEAVSGGVRISWTNDKELVNPDPVVLTNGVDGTNGINGTDGVNGVTFTPHVETVSNGIRISWTNDGSQVNPDPVVLTNGVDGTNGTNGTDGVNGVTYTPHISQTANGYELSWTNDGSQTNPQTITIRDGVNGVSPSAIVTRVTGGAEISVTDGSGTTTALLLDGTNGTDGINGVGIAAINFKETDASGNNVYTITLTNGSTYDFVANRGPAGTNGTNGTDGTDGVGIASIDFKETDASGNNVYTITLTNNNTYDFTAPRGPQGATGQQGSAGQGVPTGGTAGQVLQKVSGTNYDTEWVTPQGGSEFYKSTPDIIATTSSTIVDTNFKELTFTKGSFDPSKKYLFTVRRGGTDSGFPATNIIWNPIRDASVQEAIYPNKSLNPLTLMDMVQSSGTAGTHYGVYGMYPYNTTGGARYMGGIDVCRYGTWQYKLLGCVYGDTTQSLYIEGREI